MKRTTFEVANCCLRYFTLMVICCFFSGCATPVGTVEDDYEDVYNEVNKSALTSMEYGSTSRIVLRRYGLERNYHTNPRKALRRLHEYALKDKRRDTLYALAELSFLLGKDEYENLSQSSYADGADFFLLSSLYAFYYLTDPSFEPKTHSFDGSFRKMCDFYNLSIPQALESDDEENELIIKNSTRHLGRLGDIKLNVVDETKGMAPIEKFNSYVPVDTLSIRGLSMRVRDDGIGAPVIGSETIKRGDALLEKGHGLTLVMIPDCSFDELGTGTQVNLRVFSPLVSRSFTFGEGEIPLENDYTAPTAAKLNQRFYWDLGLKQFFLGKQLIENGLYPSEPYQPGKIPIVLVHGTMSSMVTWAEMWNTLNADPIIREKYQFWYYSYDSGKPVILSARHLTNSLEELKNKIDPESKDPALDQMVVIGHSQGGLLTKLTATNTGDAIIRAVTGGKSLDEVEVSDEFRKEIEETAIFSAQPFVKRVIFLSTPHRGSSLVNSMTSRIARWLITLPVSVFDKTTNVIKGIATFDLVDELKYMSYRTSIESMSPRNPSLLALADLPPADGVAVNSIIAVTDKEDGKKGSDGVVDYSSAHLEYADTEFVVEEGHSCQSNPLVIEEVRKHLVEHAKKSMK